MRLILILCLLVSSCTTRKAPEASLMAEKMDPANSRVQIFVEDESHDEQKFYLELRNNKKQKINIPEYQIQVLHRREDPKYAIRNISRGRYQVVFNQKMKQVSKLKFFVQGFPLKHIIENQKKPEPIKGKIQLVSKADHELTLRLNLQNMRGESLQTTHTPDFIIEGGAHISDVKMLQKGLWEFKVSLPEENQIIYVSTRTNGVQLDRLFRYQHIEN